MGYHKMNEQALVPIAGAFADRLRIYSRHAKGALSPNTQKALASDITIFTSWCADHDRDPLPASPETVAAFVDHGLGPERDQET